jgi:hypothetical protein
MFGLAAGVASMARGGEAPDFSGLWETTYGKMRLVQRDGRVEGVYSHGNGSTLTGTVERRKATLTYVEPAAQGEALFELAEDGQSFAGQWREKGQEAWADWTGRRVEPVAGRKYLVVLEARWEASLADEEYFFGDMLEAYFARIPHVEVRTREVHDEADLRRWCGELAFMAEPVVLLVASHGTSEGVTVAGKTIGAAAIADSLRYAAGVELLHFSACCIMEGNLASQVHDALKATARFPISGYATTVDWAASAVVEFMYLDLVLARGESPTAAADHVRQIVPLAGDEQLAGVPIAPAMFRIRSPAESAAPADPPMSPPPVAATDSAATDADDATEARKPSAP